MTLRASLVAQLIKNPSAMWEAWVWSLGWENPLEKKGYPLQYFGLDNSMDCIVCGVTKSPTGLSDFHFHCQPTDQMGFPCGTVVKNLPANAGVAGDSDSIPGLGRCPRGGNGNPLWHSCLENPMDSGVWLATVHGVAEEWTGLSN